MAPLSSLHPSRHLKGNAVAGIVAAFFLAASLPSRPARADWLPDGNPVSTAAGNQEGPVCIRSSDGGLIVVWADARSSVHHIYAQKLDASGAPVWSTDGILVSSAASEQLVPAAVSDGAGGAIIAYCQQAADADIYAQRISNTGLLLWGTVGVPVCNAAGQQGAPVMISDGRDGTIALPGGILCWQDNRGGSSSDIYAQAINSDGTVRWAANGVPVCTAPQVQQSPVMVTDGVGVLHGPRGCIIAWEDQRGSDTDIYAQRLNTAGAPLWLANGLAVCTAPSEQYSPCISYKTQGTAIIAWVDTRSGEADIYAQRFGAEPIWFADGLPVCRASGNQASLATAPDGAGGVVFAWTDPRGGINNIYGEHYSGEGASLWHLDGIPICAQSAGQDQAAVIGEADQGAIIAWRDLRGGANTGLYAQRVDSGGTLQWASTGVPLSLAPGNRMFLTLAPDASGGSYASWQDMRSVTNSDIYAQHIPADGGAAGVASDLPVRFSCTASPNPFAQGTALRFTLPQAGRVSAMILGVDGRVVRTLCNGSMFPPGAKELSWDGEDADGHEVESGIYVARLITDRGSATQRVIRIR